MIIKVVQIRDTAIIELSLPPCADVFTFKISSRELEICGKTYVLSEEIGEFKRGLLLLEKTPFFIECDEGNCIAAKAQV
ncbi:conserved hypothetical protein [Pyrobaculum islandicum DSM 4184]|uniref:Uncharacterized protein n=1 Tax=Pyrobaculum islandicum (strain DSM 4184 / JCM 9189 / GEO3) TaxID=384616 RepID=A1RRR6_PYRIL|nr:hypothetical protein [Pyrobaculum islandicum]ABL87648.1 conserved hypothetical protein [Pyrobaculum islandicum DSM 4184]